MTMFNSYVKLPEGMSYEHYIPITTITSAWFSPGKGPRDRTVLRAIRIMHKEAATVQGPLENGGWPKRNHGFPIENGCLVPSRGFPVKNRNKMKQVEFQKETMGVEKVKQGSAIPKIECNQFIPILLPINMWIQQKPALLGQELGSQI